LLLLWVGYRGTRNRTVRLCVLVGGGTAIAEIGIMILRETTLGRMRRLLFWIAIVVHLAWSSERRSQSQTGG
jgi:hypothetical protein